MGLEETYPIEISQEQMLKFKRLYEFVKEHYPWIPESLSDFNSQMQKAFRHGCFKHKIMTKRFEYDNTTEGICPKCSPARYKMLKSKYKEYDW